MQKKKDIFKKTQTDIYFTPEELVHFDEFYKELFVDNIKTDKKKLFQVFIEACAKLGVDAQDISSEEELVRKIVKAYKAKKNK